MSAAPDVYDEVDPSKQQFFEVERQLHEWSRWLKGDRTNLKIPSENTISRLRRLGYGATGDRVFGPRLTEDMPERVAVMDSAFQSLMPDLQDIIFGLWINEMRITVYAERGGSERILYERRPGVFIMKRTGMRSKPIPLPTAKQRRRRALERLDGYLKGWEAASGRMSIGVHKDIFRLQDIRN